VPNLINEIDDAGIVAGHLNNGWLGVPWVEYVGKGTGDGNENALSYDGGNQAVYTITCNWSDYYNFNVPQQLLGSYVKDPVTGFLSRTLPLQHPVLPGLFASRIISAKARKFITKGAGLVFGSNVGIYQFMRVSILFTQPKYVLLSDTDLDRIYGTPGGLRQEFQRYVELNVEPAGEFITRNNGDWVFSEGGGGTAPTAGTTVFPAPLGMPLLKPDVVLTWKFVPGKGLLDSNNIPTNLFKCVWKVNANAFLGYPAGTLLLYPPRIRPIEDPVFAIAGGNGPQALVYDVSLPFKYFDPPFGVAVRGHNLAPWSDGLWYEVYDSKTMTKRIFQSIAYESNLFKMN